jgi:hypothetical protein
VSAYNKLLRTPNAYPVQPVSLVAEYKVILSKSRLCLAPEHDQGQREANPIKNILVLMSNAARHPDY